MLEAVDVFVSRGVTPVWLTSPYIEPSKSTQPPNHDPSGHRARMTRFNELLREVQQERPQLRLVDLARWMRRWPDGQFDPTLRPDGVHFDEDASAAPDRAVARSGDPPGLRGAGTAAELSVRRAGATGRSAVACPTRGAARRRTTPTRRRPRGRPVATAAYASRSRCSDAGASWNVDREVEVRSDPTRLVVGAQGADERGPPADVDDHRDARRLRRTGRRTSRSGCSGTTPGTRPACRAARSTHPG